MTLLLPLLVGITTFAAVVWVSERRAAASAERRVAFFVLPRHVTAPRPDEQVMLSRYERTLLLTERQLQKVPYWDSLVVLVERANLPMRPVVFFWAATAALALPSLLAFAALGTFGALLVLGGGIAVVRLWLGRRIDQRRKDFEEQLPELLNALGGALRAGHGLTQALQAVAADSEEPAAGELRRVLAETRLGRSLEDSLTDLGRRIGSRELDFVLDSIIVQRQVGGSLAGIFDIVGESVRGRQQFAMKIRSLTAMGRTSAAVLLALPLLLGAGLSLMDHSYLTPLIELPVGRLMLGGSAVMLVIGCIWLRRIVGFRG